MPCASTPRRTLVLIARQIAPVVAIMISTQSARAQVRAHPSLPQAGQAQGAPSLVVPGDTVQLFGKTSELARGVLIAGDSSTLVVRDLRDGGTRTVFRADAERAEVRRGEHPRGLHALGVGALTGVAIGAGLYAIGTASRTPARDDLATAIGSFLFRLSTIIGTMTGAIVAATYTDAWYPFDPATLAVTVADP